MADGSASRPGSSVPRVDPELRVAVLGDGMVLLDRRTARCHVLNATASVVWDCIDGSHSIDDIVTELAEESGTDPAAVTEPVGDAIEQFHELGVIGFGDEPEPPVVDAPLDPRSVARVARRDHWATLVDRRLPETEGMTVAGTYRFLDLIVTIGSNDPRAVDAVAALLGPMVETDAVASLAVWLVDRGGDGARRYRVVIEGRRYGSFPTALLAIAFILQELNLRAVEASRGVLLVHAGAVERDGRVIVIAGVSGQGKSTLTAALVVDGFSYVTDELVAIDPITRFVRPYPKPIDLDGSSLDLLGVDDVSDVDQAKVPVAPTRLGPVSRGGRLSMIAVLDPSTECPLERLEPLDALAALLPNVFAGTHERASAFQELADLCCVVPLVRVPRSPLVETVRELDRLEAVVEADT